VGAFNIAKAAIAALFHKKLRDEADLSCRGTAMISTSIVSFLFGAALGQRSTVVGLIPAMAVILILSLGFGIAHPQAPWGIVKLAASGAMCLQFGYFAAVVISPLLISARCRESSSLASAERSARHVVR
jgi:hypothetical protein